MEYSTHDLIEIFRDTQAQLNRDEALAEATRRMRAKSRLYLDDFKALESEGGRAGVVRVAADTTFHCAQGFARAGKRTAVLNFANPYNPGGGVTVGSGAQEECLCRASNLYAALTVPYFRQHYYRWNERTAGKLGSNRAIYSPGVTVFKEDGSYAPLDEPFTADVITCAAPYLAETGLAKIGTDKYRETMRRRIANIIEIAKDNGTDVLVLGAFGCGAFCNPPDIVAELFRERLIDQEQRTYFDEVVFAIKQEKDETNLRAFRRAFGEE